VTDSQPAIPLKEFVSGTPVSLSPHAIEHELARMWETRAEDAGDRGVTRITLGNLLWLGTSRHVPRIRATFSRLVMRYPCRLFLLEFVEGHEAPGVDAYVNAYCFLSGGPKNEVCCEEIHLRFGRQGLEHLRGAVLPLLEADVPSCLWHFTAQPDRYESVLPDMFKLADRVLMETSFLDDPSEGLRRLAEPGSKAQDLAWYRHMPWRELMASFFDDAACVDCAGRINRIRLGWAGAPDNRRALVTVSLLAGWIAARLGWKPMAAPAWPYAFDGPAGPVAVEFFHKPAKEPADEGGLIHFELQTACGDSIRLETGDRMGQMERILEGPSFGTRGVPTFVHGGELSDDQAIGNALGGRLTGTYFRQAAGHAWPLLRQAIERGKSS
jgi:hypothetical protein